VKKEALKHANESHKRGPTSLPLFDWRKKKKGAIEEEEPLNRGRRLRKEPAPCV